MRSRTVARRRIRIRITLALARSRAIGCSVRRRWLYDLFINMLGNALIIITNLRLLTMIDSIGIVFTDPLTPTFEDQSSFNPHAL